MVWCCLAQQKLVLLVSDAVSVFNVDSLLFLQT